MIRLCFNIDLPDSDLRVGDFNMSQRSLVGTEDRELKRFFPLILSLKCLTQIDEWQLARFALAGNPLAPLYESGVRYQMEPPGEEEWLDIPSLYKQGWGDCEDLACARVAELRYQGIAAVPCIKSRQVAKSSGDALTLVHVMVLWPDGTVEDPSKILGMGGEY